MPKKELPHHAAFLYIHDEQRNGMVLTVTREGYHDIPGVLIKNVWINAPWSVENEYVGPHDDCEDGDIENFKETYKEKYKKHVEKYGIPYKEKCLLIE